MLFLNSHGIVFGHAGVPDEVIAWADFKHAAYNWLTGRMVLKDPDGRRILSRGWRFFGTPRLARKCVKEINLARQVYTGTCDVAEDESPLT